MVDEAVVRLLFVDDCPDAADTLGALLELAGFRARVCHGGWEAVAALDEFRPDACLIDLAMPGVDGLEVARRVRVWAGGRCVPLVAVTG
jgi:two-component system, OmpR family, response regulator